MKNRVTIKDVAKATGYSIATISYVINNVNKVTTETKIKVEAAIKDLGYEPNLTARSLVKKESRLIGILVPVEGKEKRTIFTENPFFQEFFSGVEYKSQELDYNTIIISNKDEQDNLRLLLGNSLEGLIVLGKINPEIYTSLSNVSFPVVIIDSENVNENFSYVNSKNEEGAYLATKHLIQCGHKNIALLTGDEDSIIHKSRLLGYKKALSDNNINFNPALVLESEVTYEGGIKAANQIKGMLDRITAVFSISDIMALGVIKGLHFEGLNVPGDISIVGFDDIRSSSYFIPGLTTIKQDVFHKGEKAVEIIVHNLKSTEKILDYVEDVQLIKRESVRNV